MCSESVIAKLAAMNFLSTLSKRSRTVSSSPRSCLPCLRARTLRSEIDLIPSFDPPPPLSSSKEIEELFGRECHLERPLLFDMNLIWLRSGRVTATLLFPNTSSAL